MFFFSPLVRRPFPLPQPLSTRPSISAARCTHARPRCRQSRRSRCPSSNCGAPEILPVRHAQWAGQRARRPVGAERVVAVWVFPAAWCPRTRTPADAARAAATQPCPTTQPHSKPQTALLPPSPVSCSPAASSVLKARARAGLFACRLAPVLSRGRLHLTAPAPVCSPPRARRRNLLPAVSGAPTRSRRLPAMDGQLRSHRPLAWLRLLTPLRLRRTRPARLACLSHQARALEWARTQRGVRFPRRARAWGARSRVVLGTAPCGERRDPLP